MPPVVVLVEGDSDKAAVETLAARLGRDLEEEGVTVRSMGGSSHFAEHLARLESSNTPVMGLCDSAEVRDLRTGLTRLGIASDDLEALGFFVCHPDLESEMIRAVGPEAVIQVVKGEGDLRALRSMRNQPEWRHRDVESQIRRWLGAGSGRKIRYARLLAEVVELERVPRPLSDLLNRIGPPRTDRGQI